MKKRSVIIGVTAAGLLIVTAGIALIQKIRTETSAQSIHSPVNVSEDHSLISLEIFDESPVDKTANRIRIPGILDMYLEKTPAQSAGNSRSKDNTEIQMKGGLSPSIEIQSDDSIKMDNGQISVKTGDASIRLQFGDCAAGHE